MLPNFLIVGAQKSGTTALHYLLATHPDVFFPPHTDEIHFFDLDENYQRGLAWYESQFADHSGESAVGESSPFYLFQPIAAERIKAALPDVRIVVILRDPSARAYSHYWHEVRWGYEDLDFEDALAAEAERIGGGSVSALRHFSYLSRGRYSEQIERLLSIFGRQRVLVLLSEELVADPETVAQTCADFLSVDPCGFDLRPRGTSRHNRTMLPRSKRLQRLRPRLESIWPIACGLLDLVNLTDRGYPPIATRTERTLREVFADEPERLKALLDIDVLDWWWPDSDPTHSEK